MRILVVNAGSSSLKWSLFEQPGEHLLQSGNEPVPPNSKPDVRAVPQRVGSVDAVVHRVVHGGPWFRECTRIDSEVRAALAQLQSIDPLHVPRTLEGIDAVEAAYPSVPQFACFDTAFHGTIPDFAAQYAIPHAWSESWNVRRYGFHGLSVAYSVARATEICGRSPRNLVVCHLGSGCSVTAVHEGKSVDTTMGFTPLEGLMMSTRSGSIDPGVVLYLMRERGLSVREVDHALEKESGLLGVSGVSADMREVISAADRGNARAQLAYAMFVLEVRRGIGRMFASLDGLDALIFTAGIGEHSSQLRRDVVSTMAWLGVAVDPKKNKAAHSDADISASTAANRTLVFTAREDLTMIREVTPLLAHG